MSDSLTTTAEQVAQVLKAHDVRCGDTDECCESGVDGQPRACRMLVNDIGGVIAAALVGQQERDAGIAENYATEAHLKAMHVQYDTARFIATAIRQQGGTR